MKQLLVLRHAKSSWTHPELDDHDRPLNKRGERDAPRIGRLIAEQRMVPDLILSSTAERARATAQAVAKASGYGRPIRLDRDLYLAGPPDCLELLGRVPDEFDSVMIVGHNPGFEDLVAQLTGRKEVFPTATLARISLPIDGWADVGAGSSGELLGIWRPKELSEAG